MEFVRTGVLATMRWKGGGHDCVGMGDLVIIFFLPGGGRFFFSEECCNLFPSAWSSRVRVRAGSSAFGGWPVLNLLRFQGKPTGTRANATPNLECVEMKREFSTARLLQKIASIRSGSGPDGLV